MPRFPAFWHLESVMAHIRLNTHPAQGGQAAPPVVWGARDPMIRGPVVGTVGDPARRNAIGVHSGSYGIYRALAIAAQELKAGHRPDLPDLARSIECAQQRAADVAGWAGDRDRQLGCTAGRRHKPS